MMFAYQKKELVGLEVVENRNSIIDDAIKELQDFIDGIKYDTEYTDFDLFEMAIVALEKQIPKKLLPEDKSNNPYSYYCPDCKTELSDGGWKYDDNYCWNCGQRIDLEK